MFNYDCFARRRFNSKNYKKFMEYLIGIASFDRKVKILDFKQQGYFLIIIIIYGDLVRKTG